MNAMAEPIPFEWIFAGQVREVQAAFPLAHEAMLNWGRWSRKAAGVGRGVVRPAWVRSAAQGDPSDWAPDVVALTPRDAEPPKAEAPEELPADERLGYALDVLLHTAAVGLVWRQVLRAAYFTREVPEYQMPKIAGLSHDRFGGSQYDQFVAHLDASLRFIERYLDGTPR